MAYIRPSISDFKTQFNRDFPYGVTTDTVMDSDITKSFAQAELNINESIFGSQAGFSLCFLFLSAHYLVVDLRASSQGVAGAYSWLETNKSVGSVSQGFAIPQRILDNPELAMLSTSHYGAKFLSMVLPQLSGQIFTVCGRTQF